MTDFLLYRAVASLGRIEGLSHALRENLIKGQIEGAQAILTSLEADIKQAWEAVEQIAKAPEAIGEGSDSKPPPRK